VFEQLDSQLLLTPHFRGVGEVFNEVLVEQSGVSEDFGGDFLKDFSAFLGVVVVEIEVGNADEVETALGFLGALVDEFLDLLGGFLLVAVLEHVVEFS